ncbi:hypothetical protein L1887_01267 [Cichorium endivia]|nr:hypothetical protein L1887_01267 [Cichorium endivia]
MWQNVRVVMYENIWIVRDYCTLSRFLSIEKIKALMLCTYVNWDGIRQTNHESKNVHNGMDLRVTLISSIPLYNHWHTSNLQPSLLVNDQSEVNNSELWVNEFVN